MTDKNFTFFTNINILISYYLSQLSSYCIKFLIVINGIMDYKLGSTIPFSTNAFSLSIQVAQFPQGFSFPS